MIGYYNLPNFITFLSITLAILSIQYSIIGEYAPAIICLISAGIADALDGMIARQMKFSNDVMEFGKQLDSLADVISFCVAPSILWSQIFKMNHLELIILVFYIIAGVVRLAYFNVYGLREEGGVKYYCGLPVTFSALIFPTAYTLMVLVKKQELILMFLPMLLAILFISPIPIPKPKGRIYIYLFAFALIIIFTNIYLWK